MKTCTKCGEKKSLTEFYADKRRPCGVASQCKKCHCSYRAKPETRARAHAKWRRLNSERLRMYQDFWALANADAIREKTRQSRSSLSDEYVASIVAHSVGCRACDVAPDLVLLKREQLGLHRLAKQMQQAATQPKEEHESID